MSIAHNLARMPNAFVVSRRHTTPRVAYWSIPPFPSFVSRAEGSGGAYLHSGVLVDLSYSTFARNRAGDAGLAVSSLGILRKISNTSFESNTYLCPSGEYGYGIEKSDQEVMKLAQKKSLTRQQANTPFILVERRHACRLLNDAALHGASLVFHYTSSSPEDCLLVDEGFEPFFCNQQRFAEQIFTDLTRWLPSYICSLPPPKIVQYVGRN